MRFRLPDDRVLALDDVGDRAGRPVVYLHGTPDSRLARHPDDGIAARLGVRLLAVDRPGFGASDASPGATRRSLGDDLAHVLDRLAVDQVALLGWSSGGLAALGAAPALGPRVATVTLVAAVPPVEAYADESVLAALGPARRMFADLAAEDDPAPLAAELASFLLPPALTGDLALEHVLEAAGALGREELARVPGAAEQLAVALAATVAQGPEGVEQDLLHQLTAGVDLDVVTAPVRLVHGDADDVAPPAVGHWLADRLPAALVEVVPGAGHHLLFTHWADLLARQ